VVRFDAALRDPATGERIKIPHIGWNAGAFRSWRIHSGRYSPRTAAFISSTAIIYTGLDGDSQPARPAISSPLLRPLPRDNIFAVQFHPEKGAQTGFGCCGNFVGWDPT